LLIALLGLFTVFTEILPIVFYLVFLKRNRGEGLWVIFLYCIASVLTEVLGGIMHLQIIFACYNLVQFSLFSLFFYLSLKEKKFKYIPIAGAVVFYVIAIRNFTNSGFDSFSVSLASIFFIPYCILLLYEQMRDSNIEFVYNDKKFWIIVAFFLYFSGTLFLYIYINTLPEKQRSNYWQINNFFEILKNILFCISFIMKKSDKPSYAMDRLDT
jgi:hypothetical protein